MTYTITLTDSEHRLLAEALATSYRLKHLHVVRDPAKLRETARQYLDAITKLQEPVTIARRENNIFTWLRDQIEHSSDYRWTQHAQQALAVCEAARSNRLSEFREPTAQWLAEGIDLLTLEVPA